MVDRMNENQLREVARDAGLRLNAALAKTKQGTPEP
jgi:hypothetical protein